MSPRAALALGLAAAACASGAGVLAAPKRPAQLAFVRSVDSRLYVIDPSGQGVRRITRERAIDPAWSPDGSRIAYSTDATSDDVSVLAVSTLGGPVRRIASEDGPLYKPAWAPNTRLLAFVLIENGDTRNPMAFVGVVGAGGHGLRLLGRNFGDSRPSWAPDSTRLAIAGPDGVRVASARGGPSRLVARGFVSNPAWSPRGTKIAFASSRGIEVVNPDGAARKVIAGLTNGAHLAWSPRGRTIVFDQLESGATRSAVYEINPDGSGLRRMTKPGVVAALPAWSPDGSRIAFVAFESEEGGSIYTMRASGAETRRITPRTDMDTEPVWRPRG